MTGGVTSSSIPNSTGRLKFDLLLANPTKARTVLGWKPEVSFEQLVKGMVESDLSQPTRSEGAPPWPVQTKHRAA